jgi:ABC-2 type transport system permease protein
MKPITLTTLLRMEWLNFKTEKSLLLFTFLILLAGCYGIYSGKAEIDRQLRKISSLEAIYRDNIAEMKTKYPADADAGDIGYYHSAFAKHMPDPWAALSIGQRDANPFYIKLRLLAVQNQLYNSENTNPDKLATGSFDLAFVLVFILPLFIVAVCFNLYSAEKERGTLALLMSQPLSLTQLLLAKLLFRFLLVLLLVSLLILAGSFYSGAAYDIRLIVWLVAALLYSLFWFGVCYAVIVLRKSSAFNAISLLGVWLVLTIILPVLINVITQLNVPVTEGLQLTLKQREEVHAGWDRPKEQTMSRFFTFYPQYRNTSKSEAQFKWKWYYAFQELGDRSVDSLYQVYTDKLKSRAGLAGSLSSLSAPATLQHILNAACGTDLSTQMAFTERARQYHEQLKAFYYPFLFEDQPFRNEDFKREPRLTFISPPDHGAQKEGLVALFLSVLVVYGVAWILQRLAPTDMK